MRLRGDDKLQVDVGVKKLGKSKGKSDGCVSYHIRMYWIVEKRLSEDPVKWEDDRRWGNGGDDKNG